MSDKDFDIVVVGDLNVDLLLSGNVTPAFAQVEKLLDDATLTIGSSSAIFACGAARLGLRVAFIGKVGEDTFGRFMVDSLNARGIDTRGIVVDPQIKTGLTVILARGTDRALLTYTGSIAALNFGEIKFSIVERSRHLHIGSFYLLDNLRPDIPTLFKMARGRDVTVSLDTNYDPTETWDGGLRETLNHVDVFLPNETELLAITGQNDTPTALNVLPVPLIALKRGEDGAIARRGKNTYSAQSIAVDVVDTTGAGDSFDAGFIYGYLNNWEIERSLRMGCVCGALSTRGVGGTPTQATLDEAFQYL
jgi:sugar/nucleoside kinase (ribokinase family)